MISKYSLLGLKLLIVMLWGAFAASCSLKGSEDALPIENQFLGQTEPKIFKPTAYTDEQLANYPDEVSRILRAGKLRVAVYQKDRYPFFYEDDKGELRGSDIDLARDLAHQFGVEVEFLRSAGSFNEVIEQLAAGEADIAVSKLSMTLARARKVLFSDPYLVLKQTLLINRLKLAELARANDHPLAVIRVSGERIGVVEGTSYPAFAKELFPDQQQAAYTNGASMIAAVQSGEVLAAIYDEFELSTYQKMNPSSSLHMQYLSLENQSDPIAIAVAPDLPHLHRWINTYLLLHQGYVDHLLKKYEIIN
ncbi:amino acid ABC transporter substrate-binding protein [Paenibacillaceae bacterium]|nr:amino acid ABC transporter substrate-binding protein [Paenibacillaceae bacterium]